MNGIGSQINLLHLHIKNPNIKPNPGNHRSLNSLNTKTKLKERYNYIFWVVTVLNNWIPTVHISAHRPIQMSQSSMHKYNLDRDEYRWNPPTGNGLHPNCLRRTRSLYWILIVQVFLFNRGSGYRPRYVYSRPHELLVNFIYNIKLLYFR